MITCMLWRGVFEPHVWFYYVLLQLKADLHATEPVQAQKM